MFFCENKVYAYSLNSISINPFAEINKVSLCTKEINYTKGDITMTETSTVMPVAPAYGGGGMGGFGYGSEFWLILILLFAFGGGWGNGGFGGGWGANNIAADSAVLYPWMNQAQLTTNGFQNQNQLMADGFQTQALNSAISGLQNSITTGFGDVQLGVAGINQNICQATNGVTSAINNGFNQAEIANNTRQIANMQQNFANQTAMSQGFNGLQSQLANCCCQNQLATEQTKALVLSENCADRAALSDGIRDILSATQAQTQAILSQMCNDKIEQKNDTIAQLRSELLYARGQASQDVQTAAITAGQRALANEVEQYVAPKAVPAYVVQNPSCCNQAYYGCGCGM